MRLLFYSTVITVVYLACSGCVYSRSEQLKALHTSELQDVSVTVDSGALQPGDKIRVSVFGEDRISGDYEVDAAGKVALPLVGKLTAAGLTRTALQEALTAMLKREYLRDPKVTIDMVSLRPFYILGEVEKPGEYAYNSGLNVWRAIAIAGGQTYRASSSTVMIQRPGETRWNEYDLATDHRIDPGDLIRIPERWF